MTSADIGQKRGMECADAGHTDAIDRDTGWSPMRRSCRAADAGCGLGRLKARVGRPNLELWSKRKSRQTSRLQRLSLA